jgi:hypothetical protein
MRGFVVVSRMAITGFTAVAIAALGALATSQGTAQAQTQVPGTDAHDCAPINVLSGNAVGGPGAPGTRLGNGAAGCDSSAF